MTKTLSIPIQCGDKTCFKNDGTPCPFMVTTRMGLVYMCSIFNQELRDENGILNGPGYLQRLKECLDAEVKD